jgi:hypothetical protein
MNPLRNVDVDPAEGEWSHVAVAIQATIIVGQLRGLDELPLRVPQPEIRE